MLAKGAEAAPSRTSSGKTPSTWLGGGGAVLKPGWLSDRSRAKGPSFSSWQRLQGGLGKTPPEPVARCCQSVLDDAELRGPGLAL